MTLVSHFTMNYYLDIRLTDAYITIGSVLLTPRGKTVLEITNVFGKPDRIQVLSYGNTVYIYDVYGIRFWAEDQIVSCLQFVFETEPHQVLPLNSFKGFIEYRGIILSQPISGNLFSGNRLPDFVQDTDQLRYKMVVYEAKMQSVTYSAIISNSTGNLQYLSIF